MTTKSSVTSTCPESEICRHNIEQLWISTNYGTVRVIVTDGRIKNVTRDNDSQSMRNAHANILIKVG